jgi:hypothetical protein
MNIYSILTLLSLYGSPVPDLQPAFPNWYQPHGQVTGFRFDNLSNPDTSGFDFTWITPTDTIQTFELSLNLLHPMICEGEFEVTLIARHRVYEVEFSRSMCVFVVWSYYDYSYCLESCPPEFNLTPPFTPYQYRTDCGLDSDCDGWIGAVDLLNVLTQLNPE